MANTFKHTVNSPTDTEAPSFLIGDNHDMLSGIHADANPTATFGKLYGGTPLGRITADNTLRPCGNTAIAGAAGPVNVVTVDEIENFREGDVIDIYDISGAADLATGVNITDITGSVITFSGAAISFVVGDIVRLEDGSETCVAIQYESENTISGHDEDGVAITADVPIQMFSNGSVRRSGIRGLNTLIEADLPTVNFVTR